MQKNLEIKQQLITKGQKWQITKQPLRSLSSLRIKHDKICTKSIASSLDIIPLFSLIRSDRFGFVEIHALIELNGRIVHGLELLIIHQLDVLVIDIGHRNTIIPTNKTTQRPLIYSISTRCVHGHRNLSIKYNQSESDMDCGVESESKDVSGESFDVVDSPTITLQSNM